MTDFANKPKVALRGTEIVTPDGGTPTPEKNANGQYMDYWVLPEEERAKGFVRPYRDSYIHIGPKKPIGIFRDLSDEEHKRYDSWSYVRYEEYPPRDDSAIVGKFWTQEELDRLNGCGVETHMGQALSETYARDNTYYGSTFCVGCGKHFPVIEFVWSKDGETVGS